RKRRADISKVHGEDLSAGPEILDHSEDIFAHLVAAFRPGADAEGKSPVLTASNQFVGAPDAVVVRKYFGDAVHHRDRRVIRMERQPHIGFLSDRQDRFNKVRVVGPDILGSGLPMEALLFRLTAKVVDAELA